VPTFVKQALMGHDITVFGDGKQTRCFTNVKDVVWAIINLSEKPQAEGQVYNIGSREEISIKDLAKQIKVMCKSLSKIKQIPYDSAYVRGFEDMHKRVPDISKIAKEIGYKPKISLEQSILEIIDFYKR